MVSSYSWIALGHLCLYLALFYWGGMMAERSAGRSIWLFSQSSGTERLAILGFRIAFALPLVFLVVIHLVPPLANLDPLIGYAGPLLGFAGQFIAAIGMAIAFASQMTMGASWRVGVSEGETGELVVGGLYSISRNPTFVGHLILLTGVAIAAPSFATLVALALYWMSVRFQITREERVLSKSLGESYEKYLASTPRWFRFC